MTPLFVAYALIVTIVTALLLFLAWCVNGDDSEQDLLEVIKLTCDG